MTNINEPRLQRLPKVRERTGASRSSIYRWIKAGKFPAPVRIGERACAWDARAVDRWIAARIANRGTAKEVE